MAKDQFSVTLFSLLRRLERGKIAYQIDSVRDGYLMVTAAVPGERWEIEISEDNEVEIEIFASPGHIFGAEKLVEVFDRFSDHD